jgi:hypothetical protein
MSAVMVSVAVLIRTFSSGYTRTLSLETVHTNFEWNCPMVLVSRIWCGIAAGQLHQTIISNNPVFSKHSSTKRLRFRRAVLDSV